MSEECPNCGSTNTIRVNLVSENGEIISANRLYCYDDNSITD